MRVQEPRRGHRGSNQRLALSDDPEGEGRADDTNREARRHSLRAFRLHHR